MVEYTHLKGNEFEGFFEGINSFYIYERIIHYENGKNLLALVQYNEGINSVVIPGFIENYKFKKNENEMVISEISKVSKNLTSKVKNFLKEKKDIKENISFW